MTKELSKTIMTTFLTNKGNFSNYYITIEKDEELISNEKELIELFNESYVDIVEISSGKKLASIGNSDNRSSNEINLEQILKSYSSHSSILRVKKVDNH